MQVGFIGTGNIGNPMAEHVIKAGHAVAVHDLREDTTANLIELGAEWAESPAAVARRSEVILTSLPGPAEIEEVLTGENGILAGARAGTVYFDLSTNLPSVARRLAAVASKHGVTMLDAAVSGAVRGAREGTLAVMVGGDRDAFERYEPLLHTFGANVFHMGESGNGALTKLVNNMIALTSRQVLHEAIVLAEAGGLDPLRVHEVLQVSSSAPYVRGVERLLERQFDKPTFTLALAAKDIALAVQTGREAGMPMPIASAAADNLLRAKARGFGEMSIEAMLLAYEESAGLGGMETASGATPQAPD